MVRYHSASTARRPRGKRIRPLIGLLAYQSIAGDHVRALPGRGRRGDGPQLQPRPRRHRGPRARSGAIGPRSGPWPACPQAINTGDTLFTLSRAGPPSTHRRRLRGRPRASRSCASTTRPAWRSARASSWTSGRPSTTSGSRWTAYFDMIGRKTAALIAGSAQAGAMLATDDEVVVAAYRRFGWSLGPRLPAERRPAGHLGRRGRRRARRPPTSRPARRRCRSSTRSRRPGRGRASGLRRSSARSRRTTPRRSEVEESRAILERVGAREYTRRPCPGASRRGARPRSRRSGSSTARRVDRLVRIVESAISA